MESKKSKSELILGLPLSHTIKTKQRVISKKFTGYSMCSNEPVFIQMSTNLFHFCVL